MEKIKIVPTSIKIATNENAIVPKLLGSYKLVVDFDFRNESDITLEAKEDAIKDIQEALLKAVHTVFQKHHNQISNQFMMYYPELNANQRTMFKHVFGSD